MSVNPLNDFYSTSREVLAFLHDRLQFSFWMMTRVENDDWEILQVEGSGYQVTDGDMLRWSDSICCRMVQQDGPRVAPQTSLIPAYKSAPIRQKIPINAYIGVPVFRNDGTLFGTLGAIDPESKDDSIIQELPLVELLAKLLGRMLEQELTAIDKERELSVSRQEAMLDGLTGLLNRKGWSKYTAIEEARVRRHGTPVSILIIDLDDLKRVNDTYGHSAGDDLLRSSAACLQQTIRKSDIVARIGGDEFAILAVDCNEEALNRLQEKIANALAANNIAASIGGQTHEQNEDLEKTIYQADRNMYAAKSARKVEELFRWF